MPEKKEKKEISVGLGFTGRLRTSEDPAVVGTDFITLQNLRYRAAGKEMIGGMSKINSTAAESGTVIDTGHHFRKERPAESHVLVQCNEKILTNNTAIPNAGDFAATQLYTLTSGVGTGKFADAPDGQVLFADGEETLVWGGDKNRCAGFIVKDPLNDAENYDYTSVVNDTRTDPAHLATMTAFQETLDANTMLLLHLDNNVTDSSPTTPHTVTNPSSKVTFTTSAKFGTHAAVFNGVDAQLTIPDNADFDFSGGSWTIDFWLKNGGSQNAFIYYQQTDASNYMTIKATTTAGSYHGIALSIVSAGSEVVLLDYGWTAKLGTSSFNHVAFVESGDNYYLFVNGILVNSTTDTDRAANYTGTVRIGSDNATFYSGTIDEFRISNTARWTSNFTVPQSAYGAAYRTIAYIGSTKPLDGITWDVETANATPSTVTVDHWGGTTWDEVSSLTDGTASGGVVLAQDGTMSFNSTVSTAKLVAEDRLILYWYRVIITASSGTPSNFGTVGYVSLSAPMQTLNDLWDGDHRSVVTCMKYASARLNDYTVNVVDETYDSANDATFMNLGASGFTTTDYLYLGFVEPMMGLNFNIIGDSSNSNSSAMVVDYWNGSAWTDVGNKVDGTAEVGASLSKSGYVTWTPLAEGSEFKRMDIGNLGASSILIDFGASVPNFNSVDIDLPKERVKVKKGVDQTAGYPFPVYVYRVSFSAQLSNNVKIFNIGGIPAPLNMQGYQFPFNHRDRVWLCAHSKQDKNVAICSSLYSSNIYNGNDTKKIFFGDESALITAASLYTRFADSVSHLALFFKKNETWMLLGNLPNEFEPLRISPSIGCVAADTVAIANILPTGEGGVPVQAVIWLAATGVYMFSNNVPVEVSQDIRNLFDPRRSGAINQSYISTSYGFYDENEREYHLCIPTGASTTPNKEWIFSFDFGSWYEAVRNTPLVAGIQVADTTGNNYNYGMDGAGFMYRLENGTSFDGNAIAAVWETGDMVPVDGKVDALTQLRYVRHIGVAKTTTTNLITFTHYGDTKTAGTTVSAVDDMQESGKRLVTHSYSTNLGPHVFHRLKGQFSTSNETIGYEPLFLQLTFDYVRRDYGN